MTNSEIDKEITATGRQIAKNIAKHQQLSHELFNAGIQIEIILGTPPNPEKSKRLGALAGEAAAAANLTLQTADRIRYLSYQLRTLLREEDGKNVEE